MQALHLLEQKVQLEMLSVHTQDPEHDLNQSSGEFANALIQWVFFEQSGV